jgi:hypothetical protein
VTYPGAIEFIDEDIDHANGIVFMNMVIDPLRKQSALVAILAHGKQGVSRLEAHRAQNPIQLPPSAPLSKRPASNLLPKMMAGLA